MQPMTFEQCMAALNIASEMLVRRCQAATFTERDAEECYRSFVDILTVLQDELCALGLPEAAVRLDELRNAVYCKLRECAYGADYRRRMN